MFCFILQTPQFRASFFWQQASQQAIVETAQLTPSFIPGSEEAEAPPPPPSHTPSTPLQLSLPLSSPSILFLHFPLPPAPSHLNLPLSRLLLYHLFFLAFFSLLPEYSMISSGLSWARHHYSKINSCCMFWPRFKGLESQCEAWNKFRGPRKQDQFSNERSSCGILV